MVTGAILKYPLAFGAGWFTMVFGHSGKDVLTLLKNLGRVWYDIYDQDMTEQMYLDHVGSQPKVEFEETEGKPE